MKLRLIPLSKKLKMTSLRLLMMKIGSLSVKLFALRVWYYMDFVSQALNLASML